MYPNVFVSMFPCVFVTMYPDVFLSMDPGVFVSMYPELGTLEWWISGLMLDPLFFLISRLDFACFPREFNLQIN